MEDNKLALFIQSFTSSAKDYFRGVRAEWGKISWPEKRQIITETGFVIVIVFVFTVAIYLMDIVYKYIFSLIK